MNLMNIRHLSSTILLASSVLVLSACQSLSFDVGDRIDYKNNKSINALEVPPDLSSPDFDPTYAAVPNGTVSASALARGEAGRNSRAVLPTNTGVQLMSNGGTRWLQVNAPAEAVWPKLQDFWRVIGLDIKRDEPRVGIMETDWAENKAEIPMDGIRKMLGKTFEGMWDAGSRDRYKLRLERASAGGTNIYLSSERAEEQVSGTGTKWEYKPAKPEVEGEMLNRLMIYLQGGDASHGSAAAPVSEASLTSIPVAMTQLEGGYPALSVGGSANDVWVRTGVMLGRIGLSIEDQQRDKGIYITTFQGDTGRGEKQGFFSRMFKSERDIMKMGGHYQVMIADAGNSSIITIGDAEGNPLKTGTAQSILERLKSEFER